MDKAKQQAIKDIKADLEKEHKSFIAFRSSLNSPIGRLVQEQLLLQTNLNR